MQWKKYMENLLEKHASHCWFSLKGRNVYEFFLPINVCESEVKVLVAQPCPTLWDPMDCSQPGSSVCGILQARILEQAAIPFSGGSSAPRDQTQVSCIAGRFFPIWATKESHKCMHIYTYICVYLFVCSSAQSCRTLCDPMDRSTTSLPVLHHLPELAQTHVHWVSDDNVSMSIKWGK